MDDNATDAAPLWRGLGFPPPPPPPPPYSSAQAERIRQLEHDNERLRNERNELAQKVKFLWKLVLEKER